MRIVDHGMLFHCNSSLAFKWVIIVKLAIKIHNQMHGVLKNVLPHPKMHFKKRPVYTYSLRNICSMSEPKIDKVED